MTEKLESWKEGNEMAVEKEKKTAIQLNRVLTRDCK